MSTALRHRKLRIRSRQFPQGSAPGFGWLLRTAIHRRPDGSHVQPRIAVLRPAKRSRGLVHVSLLPRIGLWTVPVGVFILTAQIVYLVGSTPRQKTSGIGCRLHCFPLTSYPRKQTARPT